MKELISLIGQLFLIVCIQYIIEMFIDKTTKPYLVNALNIACFAGAFFLVIQFVFDNILKEIFTIFNITF